ncbi:toll/interleukin-1 receptor domain-containing protein, partial [Leptolyngbya cf. ectocarpi LEGE 11479]
MSSPNAIFISYRRSDSEDITGRIYDRLRAHFAQELIFRDLDSIPLGDNFQEVLQQSVNSSQVVIAVIGPTWLEVLKQRLQSPNVDWVRVEIARALERQEIPVIPLLVGRANMPGADELPDDLKGLNPRNAATARPDPDFHHDVDRLIKRLEEILGKPQAADEPLVETRVLSTLDQMKLNALENRKAI